MRHDLESAVETAQDSNPTSNILELLTKSEIVSLPSEGRFYSGTPLENGTVEIKLMTTVHEDILANQSYIKDGTVLERLVKSLILTDKVDTDSLLAGDYLAILNAARVSAYGPEYKALLNCPACNHKEEVIVSLENAVPYFETESVLGDARIGSDNKVHARLEIQNNKIEFVMQMMTMKLEKKIIEKKQDALKRSQKKLKLNDSFGLVDEMSMIVESINGETDRSTIKEFISLMPAQNSKELRRLYRELQPAVSNVHHCVCSQCKYEIQEEVGINPDFFWPKD